MNTSAARFNLVVVRSPEPLRTVEFYTALGATFTQEKHGTGPVHWAADFDGVIFEVYPATTPENSDNTIRLGFMVADIAAALDRLKKKPAEIISQAKESKWGLRAVVRDPDGRTIELVQRCASPSDDSC